ncbi:ComF family protein [Alkalisalibacterium limincola]|uniref:ComF family protein n=1 Tax=Alkalisalibacterium limincola TaxID=2699169 RepID=A0A5C8KQI7_9GAMM|nr:ComF family protein [Alkalisalibacterium limincola]TXK62225.1 ComF family protein [Alkalisalibacterium limincola]
MSRLILAARRLLDAVLPPRCVVCGEPGDAPDALCAACFTRLPWNHTPCGVCALPLCDDSGPCRCTRRRHAVIDRVLAPLRYEFPVTSLVPRLKFHGDLAAGRALTQLLDLALRDEPRPDALVPVPLHSRRLASRGYDQALELARPLARALDIPLRTDLLRRTRDTRPQTELRARSRRRNLQDAFRAVGVVPGHVALLDDVMTTGNTLNECAVALREAGADRVEAWVVARASA